VGHVRRTFIDNARAWQTSDPEFALARIRLFQTEPVLRSRYLENLAEWEAAVAAMVARGARVDAGDFECWLVASMTWPPTAPRFRAQLTGAETHFRRLSGTSVRRPRGRLRRPRLTTGRALEAAEILPPVREDR